MNRFNFFKTEKTGLGFWIDIYKGEDMFFTIPEFREKYNHKRKKIIAIHITFLRWEVHLEIPYKHVGDIYYGRRIRKKYEIT